MCPPPSLHSWQNLHSPKTYVEFAAEYFEKTLDADLVRRIYAHEALTSGLVAGLNPEAAWGSTLKDAGEIHYPVQP